MRQFFSTCRRVFFLFFFNHNAFPSDLLLVFISYPFYSFFCSTVVYFRYRWYPKGSILWSWCLKLSFFLFLPRRFVMFCCRTKDLFESNVWYLLENLLFTRVFVRPYLFIPFVAFYNASVGYKIVDTVLKSF